MKKILVVDDERYIVELIEEELKDAGYEVISASNGIEAIDRAKQEKPALIILDIMMPTLGEEWSNWINQEGWKVYTTLQEDTTTKDIPVIILTIRGCEADREMAKKHNLTFITKPFSMKELIKEVKKKLGDL
ncbi:MAG: response regulator [bacterium]